VTEVVAAATVVLARDTDDGLEVLMLRRNSKLAFGGMWVFPGGRVDPGDVDAGDPENELAAARHAAVREAREEAGVVLDAADLVVFSHWMPPEQAPRRFATWFFLAPATDVGEIVIDGGEIHEHSWMRPDDAAARRDAGEIELAPPTWVTLRRLAEAATVADALHAAGAREPRHYETHVAITKDGGMVTLWAGDAGYDDTDPDRPGARHRLSMLPEGWRYESTLD
jgi:8-oxo-dGTP pyrophosphatase MutT (NUDIX family)